MRDDAELVACSRRRDAGAFGELVERHQRLVFGVALARCQDPALAEDVAQEAFVVAWRDLDRLREGDRVGTWVAGIARNLAASAVRARARRPEPVLDLPAVPTPEDEALQREDRDLLRRALAAVPASFREVLVLYYLENESIARIAAALAISEDLVKQRLSRGRRALRDSIATRVETALSRARIRPSFRAGVLAACAAAGGAREASAASVAGKGLLVMSATKIAIIATTVAVAGGGLWLATRARAEDSPRPAPAGTLAAPAAAAPAAAAAAPSLHVRKLANASERTALLAQIREHHASSSAAASSPPTTSRPHPTLPDDGDLDREYIRSAVHELLPLLQECYEHALERDPQLAGSVVVNFTIEGEPGVGGVVSDSAIDDRSTLTDPDMRECMQQTMYALEIDPPANGGTVQVTYPFVFKTAP
ncbi:MAG: sigma-70 family RNA polymerase sigma factor [Acidobacteriota bacterium]